MIPSFIGVDAKLWDECIVGGNKLPGLCKLSGTGIARKLDKKNPKGKDGATLTDEGNQLGGITITQRIWTDEQWEETQRIFPLLQPRRPGGPRQPQSFYHPLSEFLGIRRVYVEKVPVPSHDSGMGMLTLTYQLTEWVPAPVKTKKNTAKDKQDGASQVETNMTEESGGDVRVLQGGALGTAANNAIKSIGQFQNAQANSFATKR